jgi:hypothetical protein
VQGSGGNGHNDKQDPYNVTGIGINYAQQIAYKAEVNYLNSSADYNAAKNATIQASTDLYGPTSQQTQSVIDAWGAVGVGYNISGSNVVYSYATSNYNIRHLPPSGVTVTWSLSQNSDSVVIGNHNWYSSNFTLTATITGLGTSPVTITKVITAGTSNCPPISATYTMQPCFNQNGVNNQPANLDGTPNYIHYNCPVGITFNTNSTISCQLIGGTPSTWSFTNNYLYMVTNNPTTFKISFAGDDNGLCSKTLFFFPTGTYQTYSLLASPNPTSNILNISIVATEASNDTATIAKSQNSFSKVNSFMSIDDISKQNTIVELYELSTNLLAKRCSFTDGLISQLNVSDLRRGLYIIKVYKGDLQLTSKIILK